MPRRLAISRLVITSFASLALAACADSTAPAKRDRVALSFTSGVSASPSSSASGPSSFPSRDASVVVSGSDTLHLSRVRLVLDEIELHRAGVTGCADDRHHGGDDDSGHHSSSSSSSDDCGEVESGPYLVDLGVDGSVTTPIDVAIPAGSYTELELKLRPVSSSSGSDARFRAAHPEVAGVSVIVDGTYRGRPFTFRSSLEAEHELYFRPALVVDGGTRVTVRIDVSRWFLTGAGAIIDPATAQPGGPFAGIVAANIAASFEAYRDDDRDGRRDGTDDSPDHT